MMVMIKIMMENVMVLYACDMIVTYNDDDDVDEYLDGTERVRQ